MGKPASGAYTVHRAENTDDPEKLASIPQGLAEVVRTIIVVLPLQPRTRAVLEVEASARKQARRSTRPSKH
jgi:UDP-N-acetylglucosamine 2-epimerase